MGLRIMANKTQYSLFRVIKDSYGIQCVVKEGKPFTDLFNAKVKLRKYKQAYLMDLSTNRPVACVGMPRLEGVLDARMQLGVSH